MKIGILANEGSWYFRDLERVAQIRGYDCRRLDFSRLISYVTSKSVEFRHCSQATEPRQTYQQSLDEIDDLDVVLVRTMPPGSLEQVVFRMDLLSRLEALGIQVVNSPKSLECAVDKYLTTARLQSDNLPVPDTIVCEHEDEASWAFEQLGGDVVVKPLFGAEGRGIVRVSDRDLAHRTFRTLMRLNNVLYLQRFINHAGFDIRILVLDGKVVGGMRRRSQNDFRTNVSRDGIAEFHEPTGIEMEFAVRATATTGAYIAGVDLLYDRDGKCYVIEVNAVPGWQAFKKVTGIDVADRLLDRLDSSSN